MIFIRSACSKKLKASWWWDIETAFKCSLYRSGSYSHFLRKSFSLKTSYLKQFDTLYLTTIRMLDFPFFKEAILHVLCSMKVYNHKNKSLHFFHSPASQFLVDWLLLDPELLWLLMDTGFHPELLTVFIFLSSTLSMSPLHPSLILASLLPNTSVNMLFQNGIKAGNEEMSCLTWTTFCN